MRRHNRDAALLDELAAAGYAVQFGAEAVYGLVPRWVSRTQARAAVAASGWPDLTRRVDPDGVSARAWRAAQRLVLGWTELPEDPRQPAPSRVAERLVRLAGELVAALPGACPPPAATAPGAPGSAVAGSAAAPGSAGPDAGEDGEVPEPRFALDAAVAELCDRLTEPGWVDPAAFAGTAEDCLVWAVAYRGLVAGRRAERVRAARHLRVVRRR